MAKSQVMRRGAVYRSGQKQQENKKEINADVFLLSRAARSLLDQTDKRRRRRRCRRRRRRRRRRGRGVRRLLSVVRRPSSVVRRRQRSSTMTQKYPTQQRDHSSRYRSIDVTIHPSRKEAHNTSFRTESDDDVVVVVVGAMLGRKK